MGLTMVGATTLVLVASLLVGDVSAEKAFKEFGEFNVGGVWTSKDAQGNKYEVRYEWVLDKSFLKATWHIGGDAGMSLLGIDPVTGKWACWEFDDEGRVFQGVLTVEKPGVWTWSSKGQGKGGISTWKSRGTKLGPDKMRVEILESTLDGKKMPPEELILTRKK